MFILKCADGAGRPVELFYDPHRSTLTNPDGTKVVASDVVERSWTRVEQITPMRPGHKSRAVDVLKIQLGLSCNYACSYCNQSSQLPDMSASRTADAGSFLMDLDQWLVGSPSAIELWGGEPFLYFRKMQILVPELDRRFPEAEISIVTNGSLLTQEMLDFIAEFDLRITLSHDGPAQAIRGLDPFDDPDRARMIRALWAERKQRQRMMFSAVLTARNSDPAALRRWFTNQAALQSVGLIGRTVDVVTSAGTLTATVQSLSLTGDSPVLSVRTTSGAVLDNISLSQIAAVR
jgi:uncharacterized protein